MHIGDSEYVLGEFKEESVDFTFTSPPYFNAREYSRYPSYELYLRKMSRVFNQVHRVTKEGKFLVVNTSPVIEKRASRAEQSKRYGRAF